MPKNPTLKEITQKDGLCQVYGCNCHTGLEPHHLIPRSQEGTSDEPWNIFTMCHKHHTMITERKLDTIDDLLMPLIRSPRFRWDKALKWHMNRKELKNLKNTEPFDE